MLIFVVVSTVAIGIVLMLVRSGPRTPDQHNPRASTRRAPPAQTRRNSPASTGKPRYKSRSTGVRPTLPQSRELSGKCHIIDGDTIVIRGVKVRLAGVDAPELHQPYGQKSKWAMVGICKGQVVTAKLNGETSHDRLVGTCYLPDGRDIGAELISRGLAVDWGFFSGGKYRSLEPLGTRHRLRRPPFDR